MKKYAILMMILALTIVTLACGSSITLPDSVKGNGNLVEETLTISGDFTAVELAGIGNVSVTFGDQPSLTIVAEENLMQYLKAEIRGQNLVLFTEEDINIRPTKPISYYLTVIDLDRVVVTGLGNFELPAIESADFSVEIDGAGDITIAELNAITLIVDLDGLGDLTIESGNVTSQDISINGSGTFSAPDMDSQQAEVVVSGLGSAILRVSDNLQVNISGSGDVQYYGDPEVEVDINGLGDLEHLGD